ncbi:MAG: excinuclease ABC subunit UvrA, partial [Thermoleophilia bacterium]|nr:excinuclease ABC subunit UvrA [Thermoleophilia bacterium]
ESLSAYARQFLGQMEKPDVDTIEGLSPAISIDQKTTSHNPRSTVGTVTEIYDYLRLLWARVGHPHCPNCAREIGAQSIEQILDAILMFEEGTRFLVLAPLVRGRKGESLKLFEDLRREGFSRVMVNGEQRQLDEDITLDKKFKHDIDVIVDRLSMKDNIRRRLADSVETALRLGEGLVLIRTAPRDGEGKPVDRTFSERFACPDCGISLPELEPRIFSFNSPHGACPECTGLGYQREIDPQLLIADPTLTIDEGALSIGLMSGAAGGWYENLINSISEHWGIPTDVPWNELEPEQRDIYLYGTDDDRVPVTYRSRRGRQRTYRMRFEGFISHLAKRYQDTESDQTRERIERFMRDSPCPDCRGTRLRPESLAVKVGEVDIAEVSGYDVETAVAWLNGLELSDTEMMIARRIVREITERLKFLEDVGVGYLALDRAARTLSGGEAQRIRLATQIGSSLVGVLYILDEPSIGLHQRDNHKLLGTLTMLRDIGNTVLIVEHDEETMRESDYLVDMGPGAGEHGGFVVAQGTAADVEACPESITGQFLSGKRRIEIPERFSEDKGWLTVRGARENNLDGVDVSIPVGRFTCVTGVSGSGKSTLVNEIVYKAVATKLNRARQRPGAHDSIEGLDFFDKVIEVDQAPIGRTPRSNPATYTGLFDQIRTMYTKVQEARIRGYKPGRFSFNVKGGRCETCKGDGTIKIEMHFLPDVYVPCEVCHGKRYNSETLEVRYNGKNIADVLGMSVEEALVFFDKIPVLKRRLQTLSDVGLDYIRLGQPATTLSGGEAQRVKLATELAKVQTGRTLYILDEPTTGLHFADIEKLMEVILRLRGQGNTVLVIEHNLDVIKCADYCIDLGPEGGRGGGEILGVGTPEQIAAIPESFTGQYLKKLVKPDKAARPPFAQPKPRKKRVAKVEEEPVKKGKLVDPTLRKPAAEKKPAARKKPKAKAAAK